MTKYTVLAKDESGYYRVVGQFEASTPKGAIAASGPDDQGIYVAVPSRSFRPGKVTVESTPRVKIAL